MQSLIGRSTIVLLLSAGALLNQARGQSDITKLVSHVRSSVVTVIAFNADGKQVAQGTGFFISSNGTLITNHHVLAGSHRASIKTKQGKIYAIAETIAEDIDSDLVAVRADVQGHAVQPLRISSAPVASGQRVLVIGSPLGLEETVSEGIVSAVRQVKGMGRIIQITAPVSPGSSGSPVINTRGDVIGVATLNLTGGQNLNFAIPSERVVALVSRNSTVSRARNGSRTIRRGRGKAVVAKRKGEVDDPKLKKILTEILEEERKSIPVLEDRIAKNPKDIEAYVNLGRAYSNTQHYKKAVDIYERAIVIAPDNESFRAGLCDVYSQVEQFFRPFPSQRRWSPFRPSASGTACKR